MLPPRLQRLIVPATAIRCSGRGVNEIRRRENEPAAAEGFIAIEIAIRVQDNRLIRQFLANSFPDLFGEHIRLSKKFFD